MGKEELNPKTPVAPIDMTKDLCCPLLGLLLRLGSLPAQAGFWKPRWFGRSSGGGDRSYRGKRL
jgi:hypothetical protein